MPFISIVYMCHYQYWNKLTYSFQSIEFLFLYNIYVYWTFVVIIQKNWDFRIFTLSHEFWVMEDHSDYRNTVHSLHIMGKLKTNKNSTVRGVFTKFVARTWREEIQGSFNVWKYYNSIKEHPPRKKFSDPFAIPARHP